MTEKQKVLVCGDVCGRFNALFSRVETLNKKSGPFDLLLITGSFFGDNNEELDNYKNNVKKVDVPTYILGPVKEAHGDLYPKNEGEEILPNVIYLGKRGVYTTSNGLKIAYLSGLLGKDDTSTLATYNKADCKAMRDAAYRGQTEYKGVDILITSDWPEGVQNNVEAKIDLKLSTNSQHISWLAIHLKPRYHFVASPQVYYERPPYRNLTRQQTREIATRFIAVASVGNAEKQKWLYACSLQTIYKMRMMELLQGTTDETECPYDGSMLEQNAPGAQRDAGNGQFFYNMNSSDSFGGHKRRRREDFEPRKRPEFDQEKCWFCLSSPTVEKHLVICVGEFCYLALAKGPLNPFHCMILPVTHHQSFTQAPDDVKNEIETFKTALYDFFNSMGQICLFFERNYKTSHLQVQCVPLSEQCANGIADEIKNLASADGIELTTLTPDDDLCDKAAAGTPYFHIELPNGYQLFTRPKQNFPLQLARNILSSPSFLNCEDKADWRACNLSKDDEIKYVADFRAKFSPFDFTNKD